MWEMLGSGKKCKTFFTASFVQNATEVNANCNRFASRSATVEINRTYYGTYKIAANGKLFAPLVG